MSNKSLMNDLDAIMSQNIDTFHNIKAVISS